MTEEKIEGIILRVTPYKDQHRIITLFTPQGMMSVLAKRVSTTEKRALLSPFSQIELVYQKKQSDLLTFKDGSLLSDNRFLREKWDYLETAGKMGQLLLRSQLPGKPAPLLYSLYLACLKQLPKFEETSPLLLMFYLKFLTHEGLLSWEDPDHFPFTLASDQWNLVKTMAESRSFQALQKKKGLTPLLNLLEKNLKELIG